MLVFGSAFRGGGGFFTLTLCRKMAIGAKEYHEQLQSRVGAMSSALLDRKPIANKAAAAAPAPTKPPAEPVDQHVRHIRRTWQLVGPVAVEASRVFYERLFEVDNTVVPLFNGVDMSHQGARFVCGLWAVFGCVLGCVLALIFVWFRLCVCCLFSGMPD